MKLAALAWLFLSAALATACDLSPQPLPPGAGAEGATSPMSGSGSGMGGASSGGASTSEPPRLGMAESVPRRTLPALRLAQSRRRMAATRGPASSTKLGSAALPMPRSTRRPRSRTERQTEHQVMRPSTGPVPPPKTPLMRHPSSGAR